ncbi:MAG: hypothetical protein U0X39_05720 [Bacteroidales bacterium]
MNDDEESVNRHGARGKKHGAQSAGLRGRTCSKYCLYSRYGLYSFLQGAQGTELRGRR